nr:single-stranded DNA-binding protein [Escherichia coli]
MSGGRPQKFLPASGQKVLRDVHFTPGLAETVVAVYAPGEGSQTGDGTGQNNGQVPAKRQNRGSRNSTDDGG